MWGDHNMFARAVSIVILLWSGTSSSSLQATGWSLFPRVSEMDVEYYQYHGVVRDLYLVHDNGTPRQLRKGAALNIEVQMLELMYMQNRMHMAGDDSQVRHVGWQWETGVRYGDVDVFWHHHSQHGLEYENPRGDNFPLENYYGIRLKLLDGT